MSTRFFKLQISATDENAIDALARLSALPKGRLKDAMNKGAVWLKRGSKTKRLRRATLQLLAGDELSLYYNPEVLALTAPQPILLADERHYSVWIKPAGLLAQGSQEGDHCALLRVAELALKRDVFLVHRLDREAAGLMMIAHTPKAAAALSALFARTEAGSTISNSSATPNDATSSNAISNNSVIHKLYQVEVRGEIAEQGEFDMPLEGKVALTRFTRLAYDPASNSSRVEVQLITGRKHQIRRHFAENGHPVLGDPVYGSNNKDARGLQLFAVALAFTCPLTKTARGYTWANQD